MVRGSKFEVLSFAMREARFFLGIEIRVKVRCSMFEVRSSKFREAGSEIFNCSVVVELVIERSRNGVMTGH
jgi:hypothetical protein